TKPAERPCASVRDTRNSMFGPGVAASAAHARQNRSQVSSGIIVGGSLDYLRAAGSCDLDRHRGGFAAADAQRSDAALLAVLAQRAQQGDNDPRAGCADRVTERACAAVDVDALMR